MTGQKIRNLRKSQKLSQEKLARLVEVAKTRVSEWETGKVVPLSTTLKKIADALGCSVNDLI